MLLLLAALAHADEPAPAPTQKVRFLVMGDTGDACSRAEARAGAKAGQACLDIVAKSALATCLAGDTRCSFGLLLGDNFYLTGVKSVHDRLWKTTFHTPFAGFADARLPGFVFWAVPGNHDEYPPGRVQAEIDHTTSKFNADKLWDMPPLPFAVAVPAGAASWLHLVGIDSNPIVNAAATVKDQAGPLLDQLRAPVGWKILFAHHFLASGGGHGEEKVQPKVQAGLEPAFVPGAAQVMLSGHDHIQEVLFADRPGGDRIQIIEGNSAKSRGVCNPGPVGGFTPLWARGGTEPCTSMGDGHTTGFMVLEATPTTLDVHAYDPAGCRLHHSRFTLGADGDITVAPPETAAPGTCLPPE